MEEAQEISNHIAIMDQGKLIACGTHAELIRLVGEQSRIDLTLNADSGPIIQRWQMIEGIQQVSKSDGRVTVLTSDSNLVLPRLFEAASQVKTRITSVEIQEPNLETVFLQLTGKALRD
jgi:ABC-2 type transport system ATP-binding protein